MAEDPKSCRYRAGVKRSSSKGYRDENYPDYGSYSEEFYERGLDYHAPVSGATTPNGTNPWKRPRPSSSSSVLKCSKQRTKSTVHCSSSRAVPLRMEELQCIKRELKVIKKQIDELLNSLEHMDASNREASECGLSHSSVFSSMSRMEGSSCSRIKPTTAFRERQSLELRGTRDEEIQVKHHESDVY